MENQQYLGDGVTRVLELLKNTFGERFKAYFNGQPAAIPESMLPCIMVSETQGLVESDGTGLDKITETILIIIAENRKADVGGPGDIDLTELKLRRLVKGQDPQTKEYLSDTIMHALRVNITMMEEVLRSRFETDFDVNVRGPDVITQEAYITVVIERLALVPSRT